MIKALGWIAGMASCIGGVSIAAPGEVFNYGRFGEISVYGVSEQPREVVLFLSGDGGWTPNVEAIAEHLAKSGALVAGIDTRHYFKELEGAAEKCVAPASDLENLNHYLQAKLALKKYLQPTLIGYSAGATLAYTTLAGAPENLFKGALTIGFCPELDLVKPLCEGPGVKTSPVKNAHGQVQGVTVLPVKHLTAKWISLQGEDDQVCPAPPVKKFAAQVTGSEYVGLPKVDHDYDLESPWTAQLDSAFRRVTAAKGHESKASTLPGPVADLPLIIVPAAHASASPWFGVFLSGDGGWVGIDKGVSKELASHDIPVIGWDSLKYFWSKRTPEGASQDLDRVVRYFAAAWGKSHVLLIGYSQGADTMPFMINRLPTATHELVGYTTLLGISDNALWEFHVASWMGAPPRGVPTAPELENWTGSPYLCMYGESDADAACAQLTKAGGTVVKLPGGHHLGGVYPHIATEILSRLPKY